MNEVKKEQWEKWKLTTRNFLQKNFVTFIAKSLLAVIGLAIIFIIALSIYLQTHSAEMISKVKDELRKTINGDVEIKDIDLSVIRHFPNIGIQVKGIRILDSMYHRPLLQAAEVSAGIGLFQLFKKDNTIS